MDYYLSEENIYERLLSEYKKYGRLIIAYDFDETVHDFHKKGRSYDCVIQLLRRWKGRAAFIVYSCSPEERYSYIKEYLTISDIPFDTINKELEGIETPIGAKLYYNILLDDRAGLPSSYNVLLRLINHIEREETNYNENVE